MDHVEAVGGQKSQVDRDLLCDPNGLQIGAHASLMGDDACILRAGLPIAAIGRRGVMDDPAGGVEQLLRVRGESCDQRRCTPVGQVRRPTDLFAVGEFDDSGDQVE